ncbi:hypothetical protein [Variovorax sp. N23]|uniref:hypothetical protein n=1 Tax=Variovorax sp. N23 TaxID=2980555 RepID=UPI0021C57F58|nr:hypothetical protein [Variovorax sp. N23]MCU4118412.1 hypothetical protein [Variovorax sp. N23]
MSAIIWAETDWHCWRMAVMGYPASEADDYEPRPAHDYQPNFRTHTMHSALTDAGVADLTAAINRGEKLTRWRLQHFSDDHATELENLLSAGALAEPDPSSVGLAMLAHRHWMEMGNPRVAKVLVMYMLQLQMTADDIVDELMNENSMSGEDRDDRFAAFVVNCQTELRHEGLSNRLPPKAGAEKKVKI